MFTKNSSIATNRFRWAWATALIAVFSYGTAVMVTASAKSAQPAGKPDTQRLLHEAVFGKVDDLETTKALYELLRAGKEVKPPKKIWLQGPPKGVGKYEIESLGTLQDCRLAQLNELQYVFYGAREGTQNLVLLSVRSYPDGKPRFTILAWADIKPGADNDPGIRFDHPSLWDLPESWPAE